MKLSTKGRYGLRAMFDLAVHQGIPVTVKSIAQRQGISESYLEQLFASLKRADLVKSMRGAMGGYELSRPPGEINIGEILRALEGTTNITDCMGEDGCDSSCSCPSRAVFERIQQSVDRVLDSVTLENIINDQSKIRGENV